MKTEQSQTVRIIPKQVSELTEISNIVLIELNNNNIQYAEYVSYVVGLMIKDK